MLSGAFGVLLTPFTEGKIDFTAFEKELDFLLDTDITGFFVCGTTGEFIHMSPDENIEMLKFAASKMKGKKKLLAGCCASNVETSKMYMRVAADLGYDAAVVCPPYYFTLAQNDIVRFYKELASMDLIDIVLYNIPMFTSPISRESFIELLSEKRIIAMKDSSANLKQISHEIDIVKRLRPDFNILSGTDDCLAVSITAGCTGSMTAFSVILPEVNSKIYKLLNEGKIKEAIKLNNSCLPLLRLADSVLFPSGYKAIFAERGFSMGERQSVDKEAIAALRPKIRAELKSVLGGLQ